jgi:predicted transcriptional regulator
MPQAQKQNVTVSLSTQTVKKAKILAAKRSTSISALLTEQIESLVNEDDAHERAAAAAIALMQRGFHMGGGPKVSREELHER